MLRQRFAVDHVTLQPELALKRPAQAVVTMWPRGQKPS
jgi:hypothetical protein